MKRRRGEFSSSHSHPSVIGFAFSLSLSLWLRFLISPSSKAMYLHLSALPCSQLPKFPAALGQSSACCRLQRRCITVRADAGSSPGGGSGSQSVQIIEEGGGAPAEPAGVESNPTSSSTASVAAAATIDKDIKKAVQKTAATFAPRASTASKNPAVPGTALYKVFEVQGYLSMFLGGALSFNIVFPSDQPDIWRLMGMWSIWMFTIPSLRARDCSKSEKEALNYLFLIIPLLNVLIPFFWKSFSVVWSADTIAFFVMYTWKLGWLRKAD